MDEIGEVIAVLDQLDIDTGDAARTVLSCSPRFESLTPEQVQQIVDHYDQPSCIICGRLNHTPGTDHTLIRDDTLEN